MTWLNRTHFGDCRESMRKMIAAGVRVNCIVTSPPYWGLRDYGHPGQLGLEKTPEEYVANMVEVFGLCRELLADDGTLWLNLGDSYANDTKWGGATGGKHVSALHDTSVGRGKRHTGLKAKDLVGIPWRVAFALQADGWYLRQDIIWSKPNPMPESVTDRCTKAHEYIFLMTKRPRYFYDSLGISEQVTAPDQLGGLGNDRKLAIHPSTGAKRSGNKERKPGSARGCPEDSGQNVCGSVPWEGTTRNKRSVWTVSTKPFKGAHFATFPPDLIEPCILAGTSAHGHCFECGAGWERITEKGAPDLAHQQACGGDAQGEYHGKAVKEYTGTGAQDASATKARILEGMRPTITTGWKPTCECGAEPVPGIVFDPFGGSGTTAQVAQGFGRDWVLCELNPDYESLQQDRTRQKAMAL